MLICCYLGIPGNSREIPSNNSTKQSKRTLVYLWGGKQERRGLMEQERKQQQFWVHEAIEIAIKKEAGSSCSPGGRRRRRRRRGPWRAWLALARARRRRRSRRAAVAGAARKRGRGSRRRRSRTRRRRTWWLAGCFNSACAVSGLAGWLAVSVSVSRGGERGVGSSEILAVVE